jgi:phosphate transport system substrate-binding protein
VVAAILTTLLSACGGAGSERFIPTGQEVLPTPGARDQATLTGAGSTFVEPLLREWIARYRALAPQVTVNYESAGSAVGIGRLVAGEGDFSTSDFPLSEVQEATLGGSEAVIQVPWAAGAIAVAYNLPDAGPVRLSPSTLSGIFSGRITRWTDAAIRGDNPDSRLPDLAISVVYRSDESGTTWIFTSFLSDSDSGWPLGPGRAVRFPRGTGVVGSDAVAAAVARTPGAVGYVQLSFAKKASLGVALVGNRSGRFVEPTPEAVNAALVMGGLRSYGTTVQLNLNPDAPGAYPLSTLSYLMYRKDMADAEKARALQHFAIWALGEGQRMAEPLGYAPVPRQFQIPGIVAIQKP